MNSKKLIHHNRFDQLLTSLVYNAVHAMIGVRFILESAITVTLNGWLISKRSVMSFARACFELHCL